MRMAECESEMELFGTEDSFLNRPLNVKSLFATLFAYFPVLKNEKLLFYFGEATCLWNEVLFLSTFRFWTFLLLLPTSEQLLKCAKTTSIFNCFR